MLCVVKTNTIVWPKQYGKQFFGMHNFFHTFSNVCDGSIRFSQPYKSKHHFSLFNNLKMILFFENFYSLSSSIMKSYFRFVIKNLLLYCVSLVKMLAYNLFFVLFSYLVFVGIFGAEITSVLN